MPCGQIAILYFCQGASTCNRGKHTGSDVLNYFSQKCKGVAINVTFEILWAFAFSFSKVETLPPCGRLWGAINVERVVQPVTLFPLLDLGKIWFFFKVFEGEFRCAFLSWKVVALVTICMEGLVRVEDHLKGKDAEKQEGPMELRRALADWLGRIWRCHCVLQAAVETQKLGRKGRANARPVLED